MKLQRSLVLKSCCWFPQQLSGSIGAHLSGYSHNTKHGCTLYNNLDCLLYLRVETDYIIQLGRMCREVCFFFPFIQGLPHKNQFNDIVNVLGIFPPKPDTLFFLQLCSFTRLLNGNAGTLDASFLITCGSLTRSKKANTTHQWYTAGRRPVQSGSRAINALWCLSCRFFVVSKKSRLHSFCWCSTVMQNAGQPLTLHCCSNIAINCWLLEITSK